MAGNVVSNVKKYYGGQIPTPGQGDSDGKVKVLVEKAATIEIDGVQTEVGLLYDSDDLTTPVTPQQLGQWTDQNYLIAFKKREDDGRVRGFVLYALGTDSTSTDTLVNRAEFIAFKEDMTGDPGASAYEFTMVEDSSTLTRYLRDVNGEMVVKFNKSSVEAGAQSDTLDNLIGADTSYMYFEVVHDEDGNAYLMLNTQILDDEIDRIWEWIVDIVAQLYDLPSDEHGYFNSSIYTTPGDGTTTNLVMDKFRISENRDVHGDSIEFVPTHQEGGVDFGEVYLEPGTYILAIQYTLQWVGNPRGTFLPLVANVADQPFDFSYEHEDIVRVTRIVTRTTRGKLVTNIAIDADTPPMGVWVKSLEVVQVASFNHAAVAHDTTLAGSGKLTDPLGVNTAVVAQATLSKLLPAFDPNKSVDPDTGFAYNVGESVIYNGEIKMFVNGHTGAWVAADAITIRLPQKFATSEVMQRLLGNRLDDSQFTKPGYYMQGDGSWTQNVNFGDSGRCPCIPGEYLSFYTEGSSNPNQFNAHIVFYDENGNFLSGEYPTTATVRRQLVPKDAFWFSIPIRWTDGSPQVRTAAGFVPSYPLPYASSFKRIKTAVDSVYVPKNLFDKDAVTNGGFIQYIANGVERWITNPDYTESDFIDARTRTLFYFSESRQIPNSWPDLSVALYDKNKNPLSVVRAGSNSPEILWNLPIGVAYIRIPVRKTVADGLVISDEKITRFVPFGYKPRVIFDIDVLDSLGDSPKKPISQNAVTQALAAITSSGAQWNGKKWYAYGTSITNTSNEGRYATYLAQMSGMIHTNKGISGGGIGDLGGYSHGQVFNAICNTTDGKLEADLITLETGANDTGASVPLGTVYDTTQDTLAGCLNLCIRYLQANTSAQIAIMPSVATGTEPNATNQYYEWQKMMRDICFINRVYFIEPACNLGYGKLTGPNGSLYKVDNIHQTNLGGYILAEAMWEQIKHIPNFRTALPN